MNPIRMPAAAVLLASPLLIATPSGAQEPLTPTLELITQEPDWIARSPSSPRWLADATGILYSARRPGRVGRSFSDDYLIFTSDLATSDRPVAHKITPEHPGPFFNARGDWNRDSTARLLTHASDIFLYDARKGSATQLTRTADRESSPMFMSDDARIAYSRGGSWYIRPLDGATELQAADIRYSDAPEDPSIGREKNIEQRDGLQEQQRELFDYITLRDERNAIREDDRYAWQQADDPTATPGPFYMGKGRRSLGTWLSPSGGFMLAATAPSTRASDKRDIMPNYITEDGYVSTSPVRPKVGLQTETPAAFHLLDLTGETVTDIDLSDLPGIRDDPLAWLKHDESSHESDNADDTDAGDAAPEDAEEDESKEDESKEDQAEDDREPRPVSSMGARWSDSGRFGAFMLRSHDNKDRWIVMVDTASDKPSTFCAHHLHDEAWIGWDFNQFGFVPGSDTLWFVSEESGHAQLFTFDHDARRATARTDAGSEARSITFSKDGTSVFYRSNRHHPGMQELHRLDLATGTVTELTAMRGSVGAYSLSPDETRIAFTYSNLTSPDELYLIDLADLSADPKRLTHTISDEFRRTALNTPQIVPIPSSHSQDPIYTRVYLPDAQRFPGPRPLVIFVHGAGYTQHANYEWPYYFREHMFHTVLTNEGFIVLAPDFRASEGYGRDWRTAIYRRMGYPELEDFQDCIDWAAGTHDADPARVGLYGGSYGGFMTLMAMFLEPDTYAAGAALRSVTDWRHYNHGYTSNILNTPDIDPEPFDRSSPINHAEGLRGHLLMLHGLLDDNVVAQDIIRLSQRLIELEKENWELALHPIEPHGYQEPSSWLDQLRRIHKLFDETLQEE